MSSNYNSISGPAGMSSQDAMLRQLVEQQRYMDAANYAQRQMSGLLNSPAPTDVDNPVLLLIAPDEGQSA